MGVTEVAEHLPCGKRTPSARGVRAQAAEALDETVQRLLVCDGTHGAEQPG